MSENTGELAHKGLGHRPETIAKVKTNLAKLQSKITNPTDINTLVGEARDKTALQIKNKRLKAEIVRTKEHSTIDELTGLLNLRGFNKRYQEEISRAKRFGNDITIIVCDLNNLRIINNEKGHHAGDILIRDAGNVLKESTRDIDIVARVGGDEFAIVLTGTSTEEAKSVWDRIDANSQKYNVGISAGIAQVDPSTTATAEESKRLADTAMYKAKDQAKKTGINTCAFATDLSLEEIMARKAA